MNLFEKISHIYIQVEPCDLRKGIDGYAALVNSESEKCVESQLKLRRVAVKNASSRSFRSVGS